MLDPLDRAELALRMLRMQINLELGKIKLARACRGATESFERFAMAWQASEMQSADIRGFDNHMVDWLSS